MKQVTHTEFKAADDAYEVEQDLTIETLFENGQTTYEYTINPCFPVHHGSCGACLQEFLFNVDGFLPHRTKDVCFDDDCAAVTMEHPAQDLTITLSVDTPADAAGRLYIYATIADKERSEQPMAD